MTTFKIEGEVIKENEKFMLDIKHKLESLTLDIKLFWKDTKETLDKNYSSWEKDKVDFYELFFYKSTIYKDFRSCFLDYLETVFFTPLYFSFGKYKGRIAQDIINQDEKYCKWFIDNVRGTDLNTLKIIDYFYKKLNGKRYWNSTVIASLHNLFSEILSEEEYNAWYKYSQENKDIERRLSNYQLRDKITGGYCGDLPDLSCPDDYFYGHANDYPEYY